MSKDNIVVIDGFYEKENYQKLFEALLKHKFKYFWGDQTGSHYWNSQLDEESPVKDLADSLWTEFQSKFDYVGKLDNCYINGLTFGLEAGPHYDYNADDAVTVINYITDVWSITWGGETVIYDCYAYDTHTLSHIDEVVMKPLPIDAAILPAYNRTLMFPSNQLHMAKPLSRFHPGIRYTMMYKLQGITIDQLMDTYKGNT